MNSDYKSLGLKVGLEIHIQLDTEHKLFCNCLTVQSEKKASFVIKRRLHPVASELGQVDVAAQYEFLRNRTFHYQAFNNETCLVELDEEPPHSVNAEALETALKVSLMFNCEVPNEIHVMRKTVIDGSNTSGFQRTMIVGTKGYFEYRGKKIAITQITLEEDAAAITSEDHGNVTYRLNRLGIPLVEIDTDILERFAPEEVQDIAYAIGLIAKSTGKVKRGIGTIRQDVNVSIKGGNRIEVKGVQELGLLSKVIDLEAERQLELINSGKAVEKETRVAKEDGTTVFTRPLPGAARMYPETDIEPVIVDAKTLGKMGANLPEPWDKKMERFKKDFGLSELLAREIVRSDYLNLFEKIAGRKKVEPSVVASFFTSTLKDLSRRGEINLYNLNDDMLMALFDYMVEGKLVKESLPEVVVYLSKNTGTKIEKALEDLNLTTMDIEEIRKIIDDAASTEKDANRLMNIVMGKVRGRANPKVVIEEIKRRKG